MSVAKFSLGQVVVTANAASVIMENDLNASLLRHAAGDWGDLCEADKQENERALKDGLRLLSAYRSTTGIKFWIITETDRSVTTILLPEDY